MQALGSSEDGGAGYVDGRTSMGGAPRPGSEPNVRPEGSSGLNRPKSVGAVPLIVMEED